MKLQIAQPYVEAMMAHYFDRAHDQALQPQSGAAHAGSVQALLGFFGGDGFVAAARCFLRIPLLQTASFDVVLIKHALHHTVGWPVQITWIG